MAKADYFIGLYFKELHQKRKWEASLHDKTLK